LARGVLSFASDRGPVRVDPGLLRGEAGPFEPRLIVPISIEMHNRPAEPMIPLLQVKAFLDIGDPVNAATQIGSPTTVSLLHMGRATVDV
jgi:hypothetical protein